MDALAISRCDDKVLLKAMDGDARPELHFGRLRRRRPACIAGRLGELIEREVLDEIWTVHRVILSATGRQGPLSRPSSPSRNPHRPLPLTATLRKATLGEN